MLSAQTIEEKTNCILSVLKEASGNSESTSLTGTVSELSPVRQSNSLRISLIFRLEDRVEVAITVSSEAIPHCSKVFGIEAIVWCRIKDQKIRRREFG